ncbi:MAG: acyl-ACP--UDP-N-acetylglucosamine O-acyltransferase [Acidobacteria bacterium]|nr:acyl-ACP--UDP-N-acetylglucosamine O-acyltransferase [Acidobacteriota bacterium]
MIQFSPGIHPSAVIHPGSVIHPGAEISADVRIGPYCVIGAEVAIGEGSELMGHVFMEGPMRVGPGNKFFPYSSIGVVPQDKKFHGERSETIIGKGNTFREFVTVNRGTEVGGALTRIGDDNWIMAYTHIAHDCRVGNHTILANATTLAGHVVIEDYANIGAFSGVHQFCRVGRHSIVGGYSVITQDVLPFSMTVMKREVRLFGVNKVGLERGGFGEDRREKLASVFRHLMSKKLNTTQALEKIREDGIRSSDVEELLSFIATAERGFVK